MRLQEQNSKALQKTRYLARKKYIRKRRVYKMKVTFISSICLMAILLATSTLKSELKAKTDSPAAPAAQTLEEEIPSVPVHMAGLPYVAELKNLLSQDSRVQEIIDHYDSYPEPLLKILSNNAETLDFVLDYPEKKEIACAETIGEVEQGTIPLLLQWDERWGYGAYGESIVAVSGCGPTCIAMVASGMTGNNEITPDKVARYSAENGFLTKELDTTWDLMSYGCSAYGISGKMLGLDEIAMINTLSAGSPIICSVGPGDFTTGGHFIILTGYIEGEGFQVNDPNSKERSNRIWTYETLKSQIKNMWYYTLIE